MDRRSLIKNSGVAAFGALALTAFASGADVAEAAARHAALLPDPTTDPVPNPPLPQGLTASERTHLRIFDELDFDVFTHQDWDRFSESHAQNIRVHWPDGHFTDGLDAHVADMKSLFVWAPDTRIKEHALRIAMGELTAVMGVMRGTFTRPMPDGQGGFIKPTGKSYAINMTTIGIWNKQPRMSEEFLFWDNQTFYQQIGAA
ncbi:hypothetical protein Pth03_26090 [Planotetraspora thailandica]|uniref:Polyketide cyclase n=1 Tax=Planotetraspora thailandica TaxID=487172 RepID=A0A8J3V0Y5_9ACTN|nr:ester cyclase [Planotetraspora thailandica]GII54220.1 hypothetical protein Pth03_26090 [Planotetraspora thailandica]